MATYLLVHGAWHSGECWERLVPLLAAAGHRVVAPSLTGYGDKAHLLGREVGLDTHVDDIVDLIAAEDLTEVVLVGHSYAGLVISCAANRVPDRIAHLVYLDAMVPEDGESAADVMPVTRVLIDLAEKSESGRRVPPLPELPPPRACSGSPTRRTSPGCARCCRTIRCAASRNRSGWTIRPCARSHGRTSTVPSAGPKAFPAAPSPRYSPTAPRHRYRSWRPATTA